MKTTEVSQAEVNKKIGTVVNTDEFPIDQWKEKHKRVKLITVTARDGFTHQFIIGRPTQSMMDSMTKNILDVKPAKNRDVFRNSCVLAGDKNLFDQDMDVQNKVIEKIMDLFDNSLEVEEKEL
jgi:hypothetical protein